MKAFKSFRITVCNPDYYQVRIFTTREEMCRDLVEVEGSNMAYALDMLDACCVKYSGGTKNKQGVIYLHTNVKPSVIVHELYHAVQGYLREHKNDVTVTYLGKKLNPRSPRGLEEMGAILLEFMYADFYRNVP